MYHMFTCTLHMTPLYIHALAPSPQAIKHNLQSNRDPKPNLTVSLQGHPTLLALIYPSVEQTRHVLV